MDVVYSRHVSSWAEAGGNRVLIQPGQHWPANDPVVKKHPELFTDDPTVGLSFTVPPVEDASAEPPATPGVEDASAEPGQKRTGRRQPAS